MANKKKADFLDYRVVIPKPIKFGVVLFLLGFIFLKLIESIEGNLLTQFLFVILFFGGIILMNYGLIKIKIKGNNKYQKFLKRYNQFTFILFLFVLFLALLSFFTTFSEGIAMALFFLFAFIFIIDSILTWIFYIKTYKYLKKVNARLTAWQKRKQRIMIIASIILGLLIWCLLRFFKLL